MERTNQNECEKHQLNKDYLFCLESRCRDRLCCVKCHFEDSLHRNHKFIIISQFMKNEENEIGKVFNQTFIQTMKENEDSIERFISVFNGKIDKAMEEREKELRLPIEKVINQSRVLMEKWK